VSAPQPAELLIEHGAVFTVDADRRRFDDGFVHVRGAEIVAVGPHQELDEAAVRSAQRVDARGCIVIPGLINTHQHHWYNLFKGLGAGMLLEQWIENLLKPTAQAIEPAEIAVAGRLAALEMLSTGTRSAPRRSSRWSMPGCDSSSPRRCDRTISTRSWRSPRRSMAGGTAPATAA